MLWSLRSLPKKRQILLTAAFRSCNDQQRDAPLHFIVSVIYFVPNRMLYRFIALIYCIYSIMYYLLGQWICKVSFYLSCCNYLLSKIKLSELHSPDIKLTIGTWIV